VLFLDMEDPHALVRPSIIIALSATDMTKRVRLVLADDHTVVAEGLKTLLEREFDLLAVVADGRALVEAAQRLEPDVVVTDISMPLLNGLDAVRLLRRARNPARVVFLTMHADVQLATEAFRAGASGYVLKQAAGEELMAAVRQVVKGGLYVTPTIAEDVLSFLLNARRPQERGTLTPRQREVLQLIAEGRTMKEVASFLGISRRTAESHKYQMRRELGVQTTAELIRYAVQVGLVPPSPRGGGS
jgi:DNA-binding NarL/FixJ family response regulator